MTDAADLLVADGEIHTLADPDETYEAMAVRDGEVVALGSRRDVRALEGVETEVLDCDGRVVLPGFVDAHTHLETLGRYRVHADLSGAPDRETCLERLAAQAATDREWILGFGYDESDWEDDRYLTREELDRVAADRPVVAVRVDMHTASLDGVALERLRDELPEAGVETRDGEPTGVVREEATDVVWEAIEPGSEGTRELVGAAIDTAVSRGVTTVHDMVRDSLAPRVYRDLEAAGDLPIRVRLNYWSDHLESDLETGLATNWGSEFVRVGAIKTFTDGSIGARTAKLSAPYADAPDDAAVDRGEWVVAPSELATLVDRVDDHGLQLSIHAIGDEAVEAAVSALESTENRAARHRIEHVELATDDHLERMADAGIVASMQPNFLRWARAGGLYDRRLGEGRRRASNRFARALEAGVPLAFGSDCMPLDPLLGVHEAVNAPADAQRLPVTDALRAYTRGGAYAGFDEARLGTLEVGTAADLVLLEGSPWERPGRIDEIDVAATVVDGRVVYDGL